MRTFLRRLHAIWWRCGLLAFVVFTAWCLIAYRASADGRAAAVGDASVHVERTATGWNFIPRAQAPQPVGLLFFSGALVDPRAYAPLARHLAQTGTPVAVIALPRRGAFGGAEGGEVLARADQAMRGFAGVRCWVVGGHSRGGEVASRMAARGLPPVAGLFLAGTSHPRDIDLSGLHLPVTKLVASNDGLASPERNARNRRRLPASTHWVMLEGGNHSQFGAYGFQPGDRFATLPRQQQAALIQREARALLDHAGTGPACNGGSIQ